MNGSEGAVYQDPLQQADPWQAQGPAQQQMGQMAASSTGYGGPETGAPSWAGDYQPVPSPQTGWAGDWAATQPAVSQPGDFLPGSPAENLWGDWQQAQQQPMWWRSQNYFDGDDRQPPKFIHDNPPTWDGRDPDKQLEPYLKLLEGWIATTRTLKKQRGMVILNYAQGDLRLIINELDVAVLTAEDGDRKVLDHVKESYQ